MIAEVRLALLAGACLVLLSLGFAGGYRWQAGEVADAQRKQAAAEADRDKWQAAAGQWERAQSLWAQRYAADQAEAERQRQAGADAVARLAQEQAQAKREAAAWRERFNAAQRNPDCAQLMKVTACPAFSGY
jgi:multidrug resistance efflux pump